MLQPAHLQTITAFQEALEVYQRIRHLMGIKNPPINDVTPTRLNMLIEQVAVMRKCISEMNFYIDAIDAVRISPPGENHVEQGTARRLADFDRDLLIPIRNVFTRHLDNSIHTIRHYRNVLDGVGE